MGESRRGRSSSRSLSAVFPGVPSGLTPILLNTPRDADVTEIGKPQLIFAP